MAWPEERFGLEAWHREEGVEEATTGLFPRPDCGLVLGSVERGLQAEVKRAVYLQGTL